MCLATIQCHNEHGISNVSFEILFSILLNKYPEVELLDNMVILLLIFLGMSTNSAKGSNLFTFLQTLILCPLINSIVASLIS